ncbi:hypothetical protein ISN44_As03g037050 [Arabidopsis suecica]|uniref:Uncharacterized protein n=1 Tax=Arabidopsis suecica TaxID=45249 RepID=A0A8T2FDD1_ARASU|nr:hypothetical protein ISN44_As03g037050 [Arabidopsis suecica]
MASREVSTMIRKGFISDHSLSFSPLRTTSVSKPLSPIASPPSPYDSTSLWQEAEFGGHRWVQSDHGCAQEAFEERMESLILKMVEISECDVYVETVVLMY